MKLPTLVILFLTIALVNAQNQGRIPVPEDYFVIEGDTIINSSIINSKSRS